MAVAERQTKVDAARCLCLSATIITLATLKRHGRVCPIQGRVSPRITLALTEKRLSLAFLSEHPSFNFPPRVLCCELGVQEKVTETSESAWLLDSSLQVQHLDHLVRVYVSYSYVR